MDLVVGISIGIALALAVAFFVIRRHRRTLPKIGVWPAVNNLNSLGKDESPLKISNRGKSGAHQVVVSLRIRNTMFEFDEIQSLAPDNELSLTWRERVGHFKLEELGITANWLRTAVRTAVLDAHSELRIPLAINYQDDRGVERTAFQVLHCDEQMRIRITDS
jgi:hypothetical protein